jgi:glycosyltransferase involved in cell wall biosynthesis
MRLLFLSLSLPVPPNNGHRMRTWSLLQAFAAEGHDVVLLSFADRAEINGNRTLLERVCRDVELVPLALTNLSVRADYFRRLQALFSQLPYACLRFRSKAMQERVQDRLATGEFDAAVCDTIFTAVSLSATSVPMILNNVDVEHVIFDRYIGQEHNPFKRLYAQWESRKVRAWERKVCHRAAVGLACSEHDCTLLEQLSPKTRFAVIPNVVDVNDYIPVGEGDTTTVLYAGGLDWYPNRNAVEFFVGEILPVLSRLRPEARFVVAGRSGPEGFHRRLAKVAGVRLTGTIPDMRAEINKAAVCVVPLRIGSGTRLKILEAAAMAKPIVSTHVGAEGLDFVDGREIRLVDHPREFAQAVAELLADAHARKAMGEAARQKVAQLYSFPALRKTLRVVLSELTQEPASRTGRVHDSPDRDRVRI